MLPGMYEFHFELGHLIFLGGFMTIGAVIGATLLIALFRSTRIVTVPGGATAIEKENTAGVLHHVGHTLLRPLAGGTLKISLDDLGTRLLGRPDRMRLPYIGQRITEGANAVKLWRKQAAVTILAPVSGTVVATGGHDDKWYLRVLPDATPVEGGNLMGGTRAGSWLTAEIDKLQAILSSEDLGLAMADGGEPLPDLPSAVPDADWQQIYSEMFQGS
jgi:hypothetical protein